LKQKSIGEIRRSLLISKTELARKANISPLTLARIEKGMSHRVETRKKILLALQSLIPDMNKVSGSDIELYINDSGDRRSGTNRRELKYFMYIPERRSNKERRIRPHRRLKSITYNECLRWE
jgi:transcriptional regulator with XRE-family HTH domain